MSSLLPARALAALLLFALSFLAAPALAAEMRAARAPSALDLDGRVDEAAWDAAPAYSDFVESFPREGATPTQRTVVKVLYDDERLYLGVVCYDDRPALIQRQLGRRDSNPTADLVEVGIDPTANRRNGYYFSVNAAGVQRDGLLFGDTNLTDSWDAVWAAEVARRPDGWSIEIAIPLRILSFPQNRDQRWGILVRRTVPRTHQVFDSSLVPRNANALVSMFGALTDLRDLAPHRDLELTPYVAARASLRPQYSDPTRPTPRLFDPSLDIGIDLRASLSSDMVLNAAFNPDFGQVEADQLIQNLSTYEQYFPEKRPFFNQGLELFQPVGAEYGSPQQIFYSRRIGLKSPIFGAAKLTGTLRKGLEIGLLDAVVMGDGDPSRANVAYSDPDTATLTRYEATPDRSFRFHPSRPFHFGPNDELPAERATTTNYLAAVARQKVGDSSSIGGTVTAATPLAKRCYRGDFASDADYAAVDCHAIGTNAAALDWNLRSEGGKYVFLGQVDASEQVGGPIAGRVFRDGTRVFAGDIGTGMYMRAGKFGGEPLRYDVSYDFASPKLDLNAVGFQPTQNSQGLGVGLHLLHTSGIGSLHRIGVDLGAATNYTTDGRFLPRGDTAYLGSYVQLPGFETVGVTLGWEQPRYDIRDIQEAGVPYERRGDVFFDLSGSTDPNRSLSVVADVYAFKSFALGPVAPQWGGGGAATVIWRPDPRMETQLALHYDVKPQGARWVDTLDGNRFIFGKQDPEAFSITLRQQYVITRALTLQGYLQLFADVERFGPFYEATSRDGARIHQADLRLTTYADTASTHTSAMNANVVLRWEYRLGSTFFAVYARQQTELGTSDGIVPSHSVLPHRLLAGPGTDTFLLKWAYWFTT